MGSEEREFGSGSDISSASVASKQSTTSKMSTASKLIQRARSASKDRMAASKDKNDEKAKGTPFGPPGNANAAFDKYFDKGGAAAPTPPAKTAAASPAKTSANATNSSTLPRTYR